MAVGVRSTCVTVKPAWINGWFHVLFTKPAFDVDGRGHELRWGVNYIDIPLDARTIGVYFHYRGRPQQRLGLTETVRDMHDGGRLFARLGVRNSAHFHITAS